ncbi:MAG: hypothetical protein ACFFE5_00860 [Candidatus Thorarchaeota archaeon]
MSDKKLFTPETKDHKTREEKILYGDNKTVCFACGEEIDRNTKICPYCQTEIK